MKIISWNCNGALRKKFANLLDLNADLHIIQECENPAETKSHDYKNWANNCIWIGALLPQVISNKNFEAFMK